ncbi:MAG: hypothetical protein IT320_11550 [Anaerolineae bacterium]|nr:hypothetical protein [Anaerolineae bacterium]
MSTPIVMVEMGSLRWTIEAMRAACPEAKRIGAKVVVTLLMPESQCTLAGIDPETYVFSADEQNEVREYQAIADMHGVELQTRAFEYHDLAHGIVDAADALDAQVVYAHLPATLLPFQHQRQVRHLAKELGSHHHELRNFEAPVASEGE